MCIFLLGVHCGGGQSYQVCGNSCTRTCHDISINTKCHRKCVEGCNCPEGQTLDSFGQCIPVHECPCVHKGIEYRPGHKELRPGAREPDLWYCYVIKIKFLCFPSYRFMSPALALRPVGTAGPLLCRNGTCWPM